MQLIDAPRAEDEEDKIDVVNQQGVELSHTDRVIPSYRYRTIVSLFLRLGHHA